MPTSASTAKQTTPPRTPDATSPHARKPPLRSNFHANLHLRTVPRTLREKEWAEAAPPSLE